MNIGLHFKKRKKTREKMLEFSSTMSIPMTTPLITMQPKKKKVKKLQECKWYQWKRSKKS